MLVYFSAKLLRQHLNLSLNQFFNGSLSDGTSVDSSLTSSLLGSGLTPKVLGFGLTSRLFVAIVLAGLTSMVGTTAVLGLLRLSVRKLVSLKLAYGNNLCNLSINLF